MYSEEMTTKTSLPGLAELLVPWYRQNARDLPWRHTDDAYRIWVSEIMENGLLKSGVLIRHLLLPGELENTRRVIDWVARTFRPGDVLFSLMSQYTPQPGAEGNLRRHVTRAEYAAAAAYMENCGIAEGFTQERTSAREEFTPSFELQGI